MARILTTTEGRWYDELKAVAYYTETEIEKWIQQHAESLFPHHYVIPFKKDVTSRRNAATKRPDLALIRHDFAAWVVVEVELERHDLNHVLNQTRVFLDGDYNLPEIARYAQEQFAKSHNMSVTFGQLRKLFNSHPPSVLVIADKHAEDWQEELERLGVEFCIFEIYKNISGRHVYRVFGDYPAVYAEEAHCRPHPSFPNLVEVIGNFTFTKVGQGGQVDVIYDEVLTRWTLLEENGRRYLRFVGVSNPLPLSTRDTYGLFRDKFDNYYFRKS